MVQGTPQRPREAFWALATSLWKISRNFGQARFGVGEHAVPVIGHEAHGVQQHARALGGECQTIFDDLVCSARGPEQELALRTASSDEVTTPRQNLSRQSHRRASVNDCSIA